MKLTGAQIIIETLIEQGCTTAFGYPGGAVLNIYDELYNNSDRIEHIITAHEQGAAHAADGYARATGKVGVVIATSGPGATNLVTGIATAQLDSVPLVAITGNVSTDLIGRDSFQEVDIMGITIPITKHNYFVKSVDELADTIREAFTIAKSGRPGPVLIDVPKDVQLALCEYNPQPVTTPYPMELAADYNIQAAAEIIGEARRPYIYCGGGVVIGEASKEVIALSEKIDAPVGCSMMGLSAIPRAHKNSLGMQGMHGTFAASRAMAEADVIVALGVRFSDRATGNKKKFASGARIIHIDIEPAELGKNIPAYLGIIADVKDAVARLTAAVKEKKNTEWRAKVEEFKARDVNPNFDPNDMRPFQIIDCVNKYTDIDTVIATDVGQHQMWTAQRYGFSTPRTFITSGGLGTMGYGMGAAIGSAVGTGKRTVLFTGDGSFGMNLNELATAVSFGVPVIVVIMNNGVLGMVRQWQSIFYQKHYSNTTLGRKTNFKMLAEAFGADGYECFTMEEFDTAFKTAYEKGMPAVIDCHIDMDEMVLPMTPPGGTVDQMIVKKKDINL
ncbi:MAG: biosynthetic-type acetolactate synthase large subunit [Clostridia bacterium]|nr:biosynthetic-type acetolactate synthase large subunit [Clostridia bacterium]